MTKQMSKYVWIMKKPPIKTKIICMGKFLKIFKYMSSLLAYQANLV